MKLLQLNIWTGRLLSQVIDLIKDVDADIINLQEVTSSPDGMIVPQARMFSNLEAIIEASDYRYHYFSPTIYFTYQGKLVNHGNAMLSRYRLENTMTHFINGERAGELNTDEREPNIRNLQIAKINTEGKYLVVANHHGYWHADPLGDEISIERMQTVANYLKEAGSPLIMTGDLNLKSSSPAMRVFDNFLVDLNTEYNVTNTLSPLRRLGPIDCDHALVSPNIKVKNYSVKDEIVSDHQALVIEFDI